MSELLVNVKMADKEGANIKMRSANTHTAGIVIILQGWESVKPIVFYYKACNIKLKV